MVENEPREEVKVDKSCDETNERLLDKIEKLEAQPLDEPRHGLYAEPNKPGRLSIGNLD